MTRTSSIWTSSLLLAGLHSLALPRPAHAASAATEAALAAQEVAEEHCAQAWAGEAVESAGALQEVARTLEQVSAAHEETQQAFLRYWRGVLFQCLGQYERAKDDLEAFVQAEKGSNVYVDQVQQARLHLERAGRQVATAGAGLAAERVRRGRGVEGALKLGAGASIRSLACTDAPTRLSSSHCVGGPGERKPDAVQPHVFHIAGGFDALPAAVVGFGAAGRFDLGLADETLDSVSLLLRGSVQVGPTFRFGLQNLDLDGDGVTTCDGDCDDLDAAVYPGAGDFPLDGVDADCSGIDGVDLDGDGFAGLDFSGPLPPELAGLLDCDDGDASLNLADADGDGSTSCGGDCDDLDDALNLWDIDGDGVTTCDTVIDCDDQNPAMSPLLAEVCDLFDNDCDGVQPSDELDGDEDGDPACSDCDDTDGELDSLDADGDGETTCDGDCDDMEPGQYQADLDGDGWSPCAGDCFDNNGTRYPGAVELCDGLDNNCDDVLPEDEVDTDGDAFFACADCEDTDSSIHPGAVEACNILDDDCNGFVPSDEGDEDADGWVGCDFWTGADPLVLGGGDCNDLLVEVYPGADDLCDNLDNDCDGVVDELVDLDGDGWCVGDCNDADDSVFPGNWEDAGQGAASDGVDQNCDGADGFLLSGASVTIDGSGSLGGAVLGDLDLDGDAHSDFVAATQKFGGGTDAIYVFLGGDVVPGQSLDPPDATSVVFEEAPLATGLGGVWRALATSTGTASTRSRSRRTATATTVPSSSGREPSCHGGDLHLRRCLVDP